MIDKYFFIARQAWFLLSLNEVHCSYIERHVINIRKRRNNAVAGDEEARDRGGSQWGAKSYVQVSVNLGGLTQVAPAAKSADYRASCNCQPIPRVEPVGSGQNCLASSLIVLPRSPMQRLPFGGLPTLFPRWEPTRYTIPSSDRLNPIRRLDLAFLRLSTTIDYWCTGLRGNHKCPIPHRYIRLIYIITRTFSTILTSFHLAAASYLQLLYIQ